jgi:hypothetical protein
MALSAFRQYNVELWLVFSVCRLTPGSGRRAEMFTVVLRSVCAGIVALVGATLVGLFVVLPVTLYFLTKRVAPAGGGQVGWDLVTVAHNLPANSLLVPLVIFALGFLFGFRYFSKSLARR